MTVEKLTPMMRQYKDLKARYSDCLLFFRLGDFYELFFEDAVEASRLLNITLTRRHNAPMCGIPYHAVDSYLGRLTRLGKKVAICEQLSDPSLPGIVERDVIRVVTPGTTFDERILEGKANRFVVSVAFCWGKPTVSPSYARLSRFAPSDSRPLPLGSLRAGTHETRPAATQNTDCVIGLAAVDITTGLFQAAQLASLEELKEEIFRLQPAECIIDAAEKNLPEFLRQFENLPVYPHQCWEEPQEFLAKHFGVKDLRGFGIADFPEVIAAAAWALDYLKQTQKSDLGHLRPPQLMNRADEMILDETAIRNLELFTSLREGKREGSLLSVIDLTKTSMGGRTLRQWMLHPLGSREKIEMRLSAVSEILENADFLAKGPDILEGVLDLERLLARIAVGTGNARDMLGIAISLRSYEKLRDLLNQGSCTMMAGLAQKLEALASLAPMRDKILQTITEAPPLSVKEGGLIQNGVNKDLDELRAVSSEGKGFIQRLQSEEIEKTGIPSLKIRYNQIFGYYIEITKANLSRVPSHYIRKQTMVNAERFITPELKEYEEKILGAEEKMKQLEYDIFLKLREEVQVHTREIQAAAQIFGVFDALLSFALTAQKCRFVRPEILEAGGQLSIKNGRHPVVEELAGGKFVPNDVELGSSEKSAGKNIILLTGPNMGGKSTYLRQTALIALLAHIGSFVPADSAKIPLTDRIFTRVGASDNLVRGQSTFMVEMQETAQILHYATKNSLIILDEIGRGTSTYDGVSLAWAILEFIHDRVGAKTLFATHYHELIPVAERLAGAANFSVCVKEEKGGVVFLYRIAPGAIDRSYGIEVARLAGLPVEVVARAKNILSELEEGVVEPAIEKAAAQAVQDAHRAENQQALFDTRPHRALEELKNLNPDQMTPMEALKKLVDLKNEVDELKIRV